MIFSERQITPLSLFWGMCQKVQRPEFCNMVFLLWEAMKEFIWDSFPSKTVTQLIPFPFCGVHTVLWLKSTGSENHTGNMWHQGLTVHVQGDKTGALNHCTSPESTIFLLYYFMFIFPRFPHSAFLVSVLLPEPKCFLLSQICVLE